MRAIFALLFILAFIPVVYAQEDAVMEVVVPSADDVQKLEDAAKKAAEAAEEKKAEEPAAEGAATTLPGSDAAAVPAEVQPVELPPLVEMPAAPMEDMQIAALRTIDKVSARMHTFDIPVGKTVKFGNSLFIKVRACRKSSPIAQPESAAFLQIWERKTHQKESSWVFSGWMFSSSPSLSAMQHPVYDVWVISCKNKSTSEKQESFSSEAAPKGSPEDDEKSSVKQGEEKSPDKQGDEKTPAESPEPVTPIDTGD
jgi:hypothetical protein